MVSAIHVLFSPSAAGTLRQALMQEGRDEAVAGLFDDFSFGPLVGSATDRVAWVEEQLGIADWDSVTAGTASFLQASCSRDVLPVAWISRRDSRSLAGFTWWLNHLADAPCRIIDVTDLRTGGADGTPTWLAVSPAALTAAEMLALLGTEVDLDPADRRRFHALWHRLADENAPLRIVDRQQLLISTPITWFDPLLLSFVTHEWQKMARIVGLALGSYLEDDEGLHKTSDLILHARACALAEQGVLEWRGDLWSMLDCELRLSNER